MLRLRHQPFLQEFQSIFLQSVKLPRLHFFPQGWTILVRSNYGIVGCINEANCSVHETRGPFKRIANEPVLQNAFRIGRIFVDAGDWGRPGKNQHRIDALLFKLRVIPGYHAAFRITCFRKNHMANLIIVDYFERQRVFAKDFKRQFIQSRAIVPANQREPVNNCYERFVGIYNSVIYVRDRSNRANVLQCIW